MKKSKILTKVITTLVLSTLLLIVNVGNAKAALQANQNTQNQKNGFAPTWMKPFREMEQAGGAMGLSESLNEDLTPKSSNNIDVHMMRSTEYGAIAILSASGYGNPDNTNSITTTTGNNTGVMLNTNYYEYVAGGFQGSIFPETDGRYYDVYTNSQDSAKAGDALGAAGTTNPGCTKWHSTNYSHWVSAGYPYLIRGFGGIFGFTYCYLGSNSIYKSCARGVAVCGTGL